jgi:hypothetical protein
VAEKPGSMETMELADNFNIWNQHDQSRK